MSMDPGRERRPPSDSLPIGSAFDVRLPLAKPTGDPSQRQANGRSLPRSGNGNRFGETREMGADAIGVGRREKEIALTEFAAKRSELLQLLRALDAFGDDPHPEPVRQTDHRLGD